MELEIHNFTKVFDLFEVEGRIRIQLQSYLEFFFVLHNVRPAAIVFISDIHLKELRDVLDRLRIVIIPYTKNPGLSFGTYILLKSSSAAMSTLARKAINIYHMPKEEKHLATGELLGYMTPINIERNRNESYLAAELEVSLVYKGKSYYIQTVPQIVRGKTSEEIEAHYAPMIECLKLLNKFSLIHFDDAFVRIKPMSEVKGMVKRGGTRLGRQETFEPPSDQQMPPVGTFGPQNSVLSGISKVSSNSGLVMGPAVAPMPARVNNNEMHLNNSFSSNNNYGNAVPINLGEFNRPFTPERPPVAPGYKTPNRPTQSIFGKIGQLPREAPPAPRKYRKASRKTYSRATSRRATRRRTTRRASRKSYLRR